MFWNWFGLGRDENRARMIFAYRDGTRKRSADPVAVEAAFVKVLGDDWRACVRRLDKPLDNGLVGEQADAAQADWEANRQKVLGAVEASFGVHPYTDHGGESPPTGLTEVERLGLLAGFLEFCADLIEAARPFAAARSRASPSTARPVPSNQPV